MFNPPSNSTELHRNSPSQSHHRTFRDQIISLVLIYALLLQCISAFSRVTYAFGPAPVMPPPVTAEKITDAVVSRHKPALIHGRIEGSLRVLLGESFAISNATSITSDVYLPGTPSIQLNSGAQHGGTVSDGGIATPSNYTVTLANNALLPGRIHTQADAIELPSMAESVPTAAGNRTVTISAQSQAASIGDWHTVRDLNITGSNIEIDMPPGDYGTLTINGNSQVNLSEGNYNFANTFNLDGSARLQATGSVTINVGRNLTINSGALSLGSYTTAANVQLNVLGSNLHIKGSSQVSAIISAYNAEAKLSGNSVVRGRVIADRVTLNGGKVMGAVWPALSGAGITLFGPRRFDRTTGQTNLYVEQFSLPQGTTSPYTLHIQNGSVDGTNRVSSASIKLNGVDVLLTQNELNQSVPSLDRVVTLNAQNQLNVSLSSDPGSYLIIYITGTVPSTDTTPPLLEITSPLNNSTGTNSQITVSGTASDPGQGASGLAHVYVNDVEASYSTATGSWSLANVSLVLGANQIVVRAVDQAGNQTTATITVTREAPENHSPTVDAGADQSLTLPSSALLDGHATDDGFPEGSSLSTSWSKVSGPGTVTFGAASQLSTSASFSTHGTYVLRLTATDGQLSNFDEVTITVDPQNQPPTVSAGADQTIALPANATVNGTVTDDGLPVGNTVASTWSQVSGPGTVTFADPSATETSATFSESGTYVLRLSATDGELTSQSEVTITVHPENHAPTVNAGADQTISLPAQAQLNGTATDDGWPFGSTLTASWTMVSGPGTVTFGAANAPVTTASFSAPGTYVLRLTGSDSQLSSTDDVTIIVTPPNQAPVVNAGADQTISLPQATANVNGVVTDDGLPIGSSLAVMWSVVGGPGEVAFGNANQTVTTAQFTIAGDYVLRLSASDGALVSYDDVLVKVTPPNQAPVVNAGADQNVTFPGTTSLSGSVSDDALPIGGILITTWSQVSGPGTVTFANASQVSTTASFSAAGTYVLRLSASDSALTGSDDLSIVVIDPRIPPVANFIVPQSTGAAGGFVIATSGAPGSSFAADLILDNNTFTSWTTNGPLNQFATIQFYDQQSVYIDRVRIQGHQAGTSTSNVKDFEVQVSATTADAASFVTVLNATYANNGQLQEFVFPGGPARARFIKYLPKNNYAGSGNILTATFNPVAVGSIESLISLPGDTNGARSQSPALYSNGGVIYSFSYSGGTNNANGLLGYFSGGWTTTSTTNQFAIVQLGGSTPTTIKGVKLALGQDLGINAGVKNFEIWVSSTTPDDASFTKVLSGTVPVSAMVQTYLFPGGPVPARYVKYVPLTNQGGTTNAIDTEVFDVVLSSGARVVGVSGEWTGSPTSGEAAFDGDLNSVWYSNTATNVWIKTSLTDETVQKLYGVRILPAGSISFQEGPKDFDIRVSTTTTDDSAFTTVFSGTVGPATGTAQEFLFPNAIDAKYVQFFWKNGFQANRIGVRELEALIYPLRGSAITAFSSQDELASNCIDLDPLNQVWSTAVNQTTNQWIKLLMPRGELANINHIAVRPGIAANTFYNAPKDFELQVSTTDAADTSFTTVLSGTFTNNTQLQDYYFPTTQARYVKLLLKNNYGFVRIGVASFYVFAADEIGTTARFFDQSTDADGPIVSWAWNFGDGGTSNERNPIHTFAQPGNYTVTLTVTDHTGLTHTRQMTYRVVEALRPSFTHSPVIVHEAGELVKFTDITRLLVQPTAQRRYIFGDGGTLSQFAFTSIYTYQDSGLFNASISVGDPQGMNLSANHSVSVLNMAPSVAIDPGKTVFWGEPWTSVPQITDQSPIDRTSLQGQWTFGDGQTSNCVNCTNANATVTHSYANPGTYTVTLAVTDKDGAVGSDDAIFVVNKRPTTVVFLTQPSLTPNGPLTLQARLTDTFGNVVLSGKLIQFSVNGAIFSATTNAQGIAEITVPLPAGARIDLITGTFVEDAFYQTGSGVTVPVIAGATPPAGTPNNAGTNFWITFPQNFGDGFNNAIQRLFITSTVATSGTVTVPGNNFTQNFTVAANSVTTVVVAGTMSFQSDVIENRGIHITSQQPVSVYGLNQRVFTSDAYLALPVTSLGTEYFVLSYGSSAFVAFSEFSMVAPENGTIVTITPSVTSGNRAAGVPYNITLNQGQMYQLQNTVLTGAGDLTGTRITANKPIAVFSGHLAATIPVDAGCCADHLVEQLPPTNTWGKRFATIPLATRTKGDVFRFIAAEDGTAIYLNGQLTATLNRGQWIERLIKVASEIIATKPIMVGQYSTSINFDPPTTGKADPFLMIIPPYSQFLNHYTITTPPTGFEINYINVVAPTAALGSITLDGTAIPTANFTPIGVSGFSGAQVAISSGAHNLDGPSAFGIFVYGYNQDEGYGYPGGMNMAPTIATTNVAVSPETQSRSINTQACAVATVTNQDQNPLGGRSVSFTITGANPNTASGQTDAAGRATFCYTGTNTGTDQISAAVATSQGTATVIWTPPNQPPVVNAGADQTITMPFAVTLVGSATDDGLPASSLAVTWSKVSGPGNVVFENANAPVTTATFSVGGVYVLRLSASDTALTASDDVQVTVNAPVNQAPTANAGPDATVTINGNLVLNPGNDHELVEGEISHWTEVQGSSWTRGNGAGPQYGSSYFFAGNTAEAELRQDIEVSAFAGSIATGTQQFDFKAYVRSAAETTPDAARVVLEYRDASNTNVIATLDSGVITSTSAWHLTEDVRVAPLGTGWIRIRLIATRNSGDTNDAFFDSISLRPVGNAAIKLQGITNDDGLPFGSTLSTTWTIVSGPGTVPFSNANSPVSGASFTAGGTYVLRLTASDGDLSNSDDVTIVVNPENLAPVVSAGANQAINLPSSASLNGNVTDDGQPPGSSVSVSWRKVSGPGIVTFTNANAAATSASFSASGVYVLRLTADDGEYSSSADVTITVNPDPNQVNQPPLVNPGPNQTISLPTDTVTLNGTVTDDGLPAGSTLTITWTKVSGPGTVTFGNANSAVTTAQFSAVGSYVLRLSASDGAYLASADVGVILTPENQAPTVSAGADQAILLSQTAQLDGSANDDGLPAGTLTTTWSKVSGPGTVTFTDASAIVTGVQFSATGTYVLRITASDGALSASDDVTITVNDNVALPTVEITSPADGNELTEPAPVTGSVSNGAWVLEYSLNSNDGSNNQIWTVVNSGNGPVTNGPLGTLDTTLMLNGIYSLRLKSTDQYGQISFTSISVVVEKNFKVGQLQLAFSDLNVPVAGLPIEVIRSYDSRDKRVGDFGVGWQMGLRNARIEKTGVLGLSWFQTVSSGAIPTYCLEPSRPHKVTVSFGDGKVFKFLASTSIHCQQFVPVTSAQMTFTPEPGTHATLEVVGPNDLLVETLGNIPGPVRLLNQSNPDIFNSFTFRLTTAEGASYVINQQTGVSSVRDPYGNTLTISAGGVTHSSGASITFTRDAQGRITQITDPNGNPQTYGYDTNGDLVTFTDRENHTTTFTYNSDHHLLTIVDARGINILTNQYDAAGRLIGQVDSFDKSLTYDHDIAGRVETITDRLGHETRYEYDQRGNVLRRVDARGGIKTFTYDERDNVLTETNEANKTTTYTYDDADNRTSIKDPLNNLTQFTYNGARQVLTITDARNKVTTNTYDPAGTNLLTTKDPLNNITTYTYSIFTGQRTTMKDALEKTTTYDYDNAGRLTTETDPLGHATTYGYDTNGNRTSQTVTRTNAQGQTETITTTFTYDKLNRLTKTTFADGSFTRVEYSVTGHESANIDQLGHRTEFTYDDMGRLTRTDYPDGTHDETTYDAEGRRLTSKDRAGRVTSYEYDELGRLTKTTYADSTFTTTEYDAIGRILVVTDGRGNKTTYEYDPNCGCSKRKAKVIDALNRASTFTYDANGNQTSMTDALGHTTTYEYDEDNRLIKTTYHDNTFKTIAYDAVGRTASNTDQAGKLTQFSYDAAGRLIKIKDALDHETRYTYDELGQRTEQIDALNRVTRYEYDQLGRRSKRRLPMGQVELYSYTLDGRVQSKTDFNGKSTTYSYDAVGRLLGKTPDASLNQPAVNFTYTATGQRATMSDASGSTVYNYDNRNRLITAQTPQGTLTYTYDAQGNLLTTRSSNQAGLTVDYTYDELNRLATVKDNSLPNSANTSTYTYDEVGNLKDLQYPNSVKTSYTYNAVNRLTNLNVGIGQSTLTSYAYTLAPAGNRTAVAEFGGRTVTYSYDDLYRLTAETIAGAATENGSISYNYDAAGNRLSRTSSIPALSSTSRTFDDNDRLTSDSYDGNGNTTSSSGNNYVYDFEDHLTSLNNGAVSLVYDGDGNRVARTVNGVTTRYLVDTNNPTGHPQVVDELTNSQVTRTYIFGHNLISQRQLINSEWVASFYAYDGQGSVRLLTDGSGNVTDTYTYDAFGNLIAATGTTPNEHLYSGERLDANLGFYYLRARYLNPSTGRFWTMDSYEGNSYDPASLHKYLYAGGDPVNRIDPTGHMYIASEAQAVAVRATLSAMSALQALIIAAEIVCTLNFAVTAQLNDADLPTGAPTPCDAPRGARDPSLFHYTDILSAALIQSTGFILASGDKKFGGFTFPAGAYATDIQPTDPTYTQRSLSALFYGGNESRDVSWYVEIARGAFTELRYPGFARQWIHYAPLAGFPVKVKVRRIGINKMPP